MTRKEALTALLEKVEAGEILFPNDFPADFPKKPCAIGAFNGSLDTAKALHEAVLPDEGWEVLERARYSELIPSPFSGRYLASVGWGKAIYGSGDNPARAWLIAILSALIAETGEG